MVAKKVRPTNTITHWGWDHTKGVKNTDTFDAEMFRYVEAVRAKEIGEMLGDIQNLIRTHRKYKGMMILACFLYYHRVPSI